IDVVSFKRGDKVSLILAAANLDPAKFTDPLTFKPDRRDFPVAEGKAHGRLNHRPLRLIRKEWITIADTAGPARGSGRRP
ncbi:hypothetical protein AB9F35_35815, partial [Rhizobium leguminosarum]|uniref:hypothetical protein n=1 Tax=Rhizobium leguminosarum TaxID=384 RepID=UPI003F97D76F